MFAPVGEKEVSRAMGRDFSEHFDQILDTDVIIVGGGPSGLVCARDLALRGVKTLIIESKNNPGGGFWVGGFLMPLATFREPSQKMLEEFGIPCKLVGKGLWGCQAPYAAAKLIVAALDAGAMLQNMTQFQDLVLRAGPEGRPRVGGVVVNWSSVALVPNHVSCIDPIALESKLVVDATGHDAWVMAKLQENGLLKLPGHGSMWIERSEELVVEHTGVAYPGVVVTGMAVATVYGLPRMGPTFGSMLISGRRAAEACLKELGRGESARSGG